QNRPDGCRKRLIGATACGSIVPSQGAKTATATMPTRMAAPMSAVGCRLNASRKRCHVGDTDLTATIDGAASVVTSPISDAGPYEYSERGAHEASNSECADRRTRTIG